MKFIECEFVCKDNLLIFILLDDVCEIIWFKCFEFLLNKYMVNGFLWELIKVMVLLSELYVKIDKIGLKILFLVICKFWLGLIVNVNGISCFFMYGINLLFGLIVISLVFCCWVLVSIFKIWL